MLTSTYSLVAIAAEHDHARSRLSRLRQQLQSSWKALHQIDFAFLDNTHQRLLQFDAYFRKRKIELHLIPVLRALGREAQNLLNELDALSARASMLLGAIAEQLRGLFDAPEQARAAVDGYCASLSQRLEREDKELLPLARRLLSVEDWFSIATQMLEDDTGGRRRRVFAPARATIAPARSLNAG